jgi:hypothetical protein
MNIMENIGRKNTLYERDGMIMDSMGRRNFFGSVKKNLVVEEDRLEIKMHRGCLDILNGVDLGNNSRMNLFEDLFHAIGTDDLRGAYCDSLELILLSLLLELHG